MFRPYDRGPEYRQVPSLIGMYISLTRVSGVLLALPFAPYSSDRLGRKRTLFAGAVLMCAGVTLQTISTTIAQFIAARLLSEHPVSLACLWQSLPVDSHRFQLALAFASQRTRLHW